MFALSKLFTASQVGAAFDATVYRAAMVGGIDRQFAKLAADTFGLPLCKADGNPIGKVAFLKLADTFRADKGATKGQKIKGEKPQVYVSGYVQRAQIGAALDAIALALYCGKEGVTEEKAQALNDAGQYLTPEQWQALTKPAPKAPKVDAPAPVVGEAAPVALDKASPAKREQAAPSGPLPVTEAPAAAPAAAPAPAPAPAPALSREVAFDVVLLGVQTGAYSVAQLQDLAQACAVALASAQELAPV